MFEPSIEILLNKKSGELVLDDELVVSRAADVESQNHSDRKAGKDGPVAEAIADSHLGINDGFRLRLSGETTIDNIQLLLNRLPTLTSIQLDVEIKFDRGYGKVAILLTVGAKGYSMRCSLRNWIQTSLHQVSRCSRLQREFDSSRCMAGARGILSWPQLWTTVSSNGLDETNQLRQ